MFHDLEGNGAEGNEPVIPDDLRLNYIRFKELLMRLGIISELTHAASALESQESNLILDLWQLL